MARRRRYNGIVSLGALDLPKQVSTVDVLAGLVAGLVGSAGLMAVIQKYAPDVAEKVKSTLGAAFPLAGGISVAAILFAVQNKSNPQRAMGHAVGAAAAGGFVALLNYLKTAKPFGLTFDAPPVALSLSDYNGLLVDNSVQRQMSGLIVDNNASLGQLGALSMGGDDEVGYADIVALRA